MGPKKKSKAVKDDKVNPCIIHFPECKELGTVSLNESRFLNIQKIAEKRQSQPPGCPSRLNDACQQIPVTYSAGAGYHRKCPY